MIGILCLGQPFPGLPWGVCRGFDHHFISLASLWGCRGEEYCLCLVVREAGVARKGGCHSPLGQGVLEPGLLACGQGCLYSQRGPRSLSCLSCGVVSRAVEIQHQTEELNLGRMGSKAGLGDASGDDPRHLRSPGADEERGLHRAL